MLKYQLKRKIAIFILAFFVFGFNSHLVVAESLPEFSLYPNDPKLGQQYYLAQIKALSAWTIIKESPDVVVAVIDSGVDIEHPDLADNIWQNTREIRNDNIDNDHNGYVDDVNGWDFVINSADPRPKVVGQYTSLGINHGTLVAGVLGAVGNNNYGLAGVAWKIKIMPLRVMDEKGAGNTQSVYQAVKYALENGADIINLSMVGDAYDPALEEIIAQAYQQGLIIVAAAGNESNHAYQKDDFSLDLAVHPQYPICHDGPRADNNFILGVGSVNSQDKKSRFSNFGSKCLDLVAPGESFYGALYFSPVRPDFNEYFSGWWSGTSLAAPQVSAAAGLLKAYRPELSNREIYEILIESADNINSRNPNYQNLLGGGRLNIKAALSAAAAKAAATVKLAVAPQGDYLPQVVIYDASGQERASFLAYSEKFKGGVNLAMADLDADNANEVITGAGQGGGPHVRVFKTDGTLLKQFFAYDVKFSGGVNLVAQSSSAFGQAKIITAPQSKFKPLIKIFNADGVLLKEFLAFSEKFTGGVNLALGDINGDNEMEIFASSGPGQPPLVRIFTQDGKLIREFLAGDKNYRGGIKISAADLYSDIRAELAVVPQDQSQAEVSIYSLTGELDYRWPFKRADKLKIGLSVSGRLDMADGKVLLSVSGGQQQSEVFIYDVRGRLLNKFKALSADFGGGLNLTSR